MFSEVDTYRPLTQLLRPEFYSENLKLCPEDTEDFAVYRKHHVKL